MQPSLILLRPYWILAETHLNRAWSCDRDKFWHFDMFGSVPSNGPKRHEMTRFLTTAAVSAGPSAPFLPPPCGPRRSSAELMHRSNGCSVGDKPPVRRPGTPLRRDSPSSDIRRTFEIRGEYSCVMFTECVKPGTSQLAFGNKILL